MELRKPIKHSIEKVHASKKLGIAFGWLCVSKVDGQDYYDLHGHHMPPEELVPAALSFAKAGGDGDIMHGDKVVAKTHFILPIDDEMYAAMGVTKFSKTGIFIGWKPDDAADLEKIASGEMAEFSLMGTAYLEPVEE